MWLVIPASRSIGNALAEDGSELGGAEMFVLCWCSSSSLLFGIFVAILLHSTVKPIKHVGNAGN